MLGETFFSSGSPGDRRRGGRWKRIVGRDAAGKQNGETAWKTGCRFSLYVVVVSGDPAAVAAFPAKNAKMADTSVQKKGGEGGMEGAATNAPSPTWKGPLSSFLQLFIFFCHPIIFIDYIIYVQARNKRNRRNDDFTLNIIKCIIKYILYTNCIKIWWIG